MTAPALTKLAALIRLLASDKDGEVLGAARAIGRLLTAGGLDFHDLANVVATAIEKPEEPEIEADNADHLAMACFCLDGNWHYRDRDREFLRDACRLLRRGFKLSSRQLDWLTDLHQRARRAAA